MKFSIKMLTTKFVTVSLALTVAFSASAAILMPQPVQAYSKNIQTGINLITTANWYLGVRYKFGAKTNIEYEFDCSSLTKYVFGRNYMYLPRTSIEQSKMGKYVSKSNLKKGDLVFFTTSASGKKIAHVGIYSEKGYFVHTYGKGGVTYSNINSGWWKDHYVTARRIFG
ncbi:NlpC/P60 family protein [Paenibacillus psychroresistens]|uniref:NlpC/P60 family protein n=1 Tax=Paenibacillus psychroresistens TaxID=1778678 RepID=A0A6B8RLU3_9BACL|nr:C40 family peptidase [Paenibacillus psychroresistens]QGQ96513.1 NlpC/P60 family protein [Paenibacillus psychroresistens]